MSLFLQFNAEKIKEPYLKMTDIGFNMFTYNYYFRGALGKILSCIGIGGGGTHLAINNLGALFLQSMWMKRKKNPTGMVFNMFVLKNLYLS